MDMTSGYHQIRVDKESSNLLAISTPMGRYKFTVLAQGVCSSSDIFNFLTDGSCCRDNSGALKNMDDVLLHGRTLEELKMKLESFLAWRSCHIQQTGEERTSSMHTPQRQGYPGLLQHEETTDKEGYTVILWDVVITTTQPTS
jgi:hypothetical protein